MHDSIRIRGARLHNLKGINVDIPRGKLVVVTGLSGSGKSTLVLETLHREGQRQFMEAHGMVTDALRKPQVDNIEGLSPSIAIGQNLVNRNPRSTVGTATEVYTYLRVLYARLGRRPCPNCGASVVPPYDASDPMEAPELAADEMGTEPVPPGASCPCPACGASVPQLGMGHFSFNTPEGACPSCTGLGTVREADLERLLDPGKSILDGGVRIWDGQTAARYAEVLANASRRYGFPFEPTAPVGELGSAPRDLLLYGVRSPRFTRHYPELEPPTSIAQGNFEGIVTNLLRRYEEHAEDPEYRERQEMEKLLELRTCPDCGGERLRRESRAVTVRGLNIVAVSRLPLSRLAPWLEELRPALPPTEAGIAEPVLDDLRERLRRLVDAGVGYLTLEQPSPSLSAGEGQRLRLAALLGSGLTGVLYVLDEPTIGLHPRDTGPLVATLRRLRDLGNTVVVIEHDLEVIRSADHLIEIGPGAGEAGGSVVLAASPDEASQHAESVTGPYLSGLSATEVPGRRRLAGSNRITIWGAREHNLKDVTVGIPLGGLVAVTGVSGSGKSSLLLDVLDRATRRHYYGATDAPGEHDAIEGWEHITKVVTLDQAPIGRSPRSNTATYTGAFTPIREVFARTDEARGRGLTARHFSFNVPGGRCERCQGAGVLSVRMHFLSDATVRCPTCRGRRFRPEVLQGRCQLEQWG